MRKRWLVLSLGILAGCQAAPKPQARRFTPEELEAKFPADLGQAYVDASAYPPTPRAGYEVFLAKCSLCHSPARALNSPIVDREDWTRFVSRMHGKAGKWYGGPLLDGAEGQELIEFLVYDAHKRKVEGAESFQQERLRLEALFQEVMKERGRVRGEDDAQKIGGSAPYVGDKP